MKDEDFKYICEVESCKKECGQVFSVIEEVEGKKKLIWKCRKCNEK